MAVARACAQHPPPCSHHKGRGVGDEEGDPPHAAEALGAHPAAGGCGERPGLPAWVHAHACMRVACLRARMRARARGIAPCPHPWAHATRARAQVLHRCVHARTHAPPFPISPPSPLYHRHCTAALLQEKLVSDMEKALTKRELISFKGRASQVMGCCSCWLRVHAYACIFIGVCGWGACMCECMLVAHLAAGGGATQLPQHQALVACCFRHSQPHPLPPTPRRRLLPAGQGPQHRRRERHADAHPAGQGHHRHGPFHQGGCARPA